MKKNILKLLLISLFLIPNLVDAAPSASASCSASKTVTLNNTVTVTVRGTSSEAMWHTTLSYDSSKLQYVSGSGLQAISDDFVTGITYTYTFKAVAEGTAYVKTSSSISDYDGEKAFPSSSCSINIVKASAPSNNNGSSVKKSSDNNLSSITIEGVTLSPDFSKDVYNYTAQVENDIEKIKIETKTSNNKATVSGSGEKELVEGENKFELVVTAENGATKTYTVTIDRKEKDPIEVEIDGVKYNLLRNIKDIEIPEMFEEGTIKIGEDEVPVFKNDKLNYILVVLKDSKGEIHFYNYDNGRYTKFNQVLSDNVNFIVLEMEKVPTNYKKVIIDINGKKVECYKVSGDTRLLVYGMNLSTGKKNYYTYDRDEKTLQVFDVDSYEENLENVKNNEYLIYGLSAGVLLLFLLNLLLASKSRKQKKLINMAKEVVVEVSEDNKKNKSKKEKVVEEVKEDIEDDEEYYDPDPYNILSDKKKLKRKKK